MNDMAAVDPPGAAPPRVRAPSPARAVADAVAGGAGLVVAVGPDPAVRRACADAVARARLAAGDDVVVLVPAADGLTDATLAAALGLDAEAIPAALFGLPPLYAMAGLRLVAIVRDAERLSADNLAGLRELAALRSPALTILLVGDEGLVPIADALMAVGLHFMRLETEPEAEADGGPVWPEPIAAHDGGPDGPEAPYAYRPVDITFSPVLPDWVAPDVPVLIPAEDVPPAPLDETVAEETAPDGAAGVPAAPPDTPVAGAPDDPAAWIASGETAGSDGSPPAEPVPAEVAESPDTAAAEAWLEPYPLDDPLPQSRDGSEEGRRFEEYSSAFAYLAARDADAGQDDVPPEPGEAAGAPLAHPMPAAAPSVRSRSRVRSIAAAVIVVALLGAGWLIAGRTTPAHKSQSVMAGGSPPPRSAALRPQGPAAPPSGEAALREVTGASAAASQPTAGATSPASSATSPQPAPSRAAETGGTAATQPAPKPVEAAAPPVHPATAPDAETAATTAGTATAGTATAGTATAPPARPAPVPSADTRAAASAAATAAAPTATATVTATGAPAPPPPPPLPPPRPPAPAAVATAAAPSPGVAAATGGAPGHAPENATATAAQAVARPAGPGLLVIAKANDTLRSLYDRVYRGLQAPPFAAVAAMNPSDIRLGDVVVFPAPPGGWKRLSGLDR